MTDQAQNKPIKPIKHPQTGFRRWVLTNRLPQKYRQMVRFVIAGSVGATIQYCLYRGGLAIAEHYWPTIHIASLVYALAYMLEACNNYIMTAFYTFSSRPNLRNFWGFVTSRITDFLTQMLIIQSLLLASVEERLAGILTIVLAGCINFFVVRFFFKDRNHPRQNQA